MIIQFLTAQVLEMITMMSIIISSGMRVNSPPQFDN